MELTRRERALLEEAKRAQGGDPVSPYLTLVTFMVGPILICLALFAVSLFSDSFDLSGAICLACITVGLVSWAWRDVRRRQTTYSLVQKLNDANGQEPDTPVDRE